jgi:hypothetical protein
LQRICAATQIRLIPAESGCLVAQGGTKGGTRLGRHQPDAGRSRRL